MKGVVHAFRKGFTLVELLVVVAIIILLAALLFPTLERARYKSRFAPCASNLRQIMAAATVFAGDNKGLYPGYKMNKGMPVPNRRRSYDNVASGLEPYVGGSVDWKKNKLFVCPQAMLWSKTLTNNTILTFYSTHWNSYLGLPSGLYGSYPNYSPKDPAESFYGPSGSRKFRAISGTWGGGDWDSPIAAQDNCHLNGTSQGAIVSGHMWGGLTVQTYGHGSGPCGWGWKVGAQYSANYAFADGSVQVFHFIHPGLNIGANTIVRVISSNGIGEDAPILPTVWLRTWP